MLRQWSQIVLCIMLPGTSIYFNSPSLVHQKIPFIPHLQYLGLLCFQFNNPTVNEKMGVWGKSSNGKAMGNPWRMIHSYIYIYVYSCEYTYIHMYACIHLCIYMYVYERMYVCVELYWGSDPGICTCWIQVLPTKLQFQTCLLST